jgi:hypothetical protein
MQLHARKSQITRVEMLLEEIVLSSLFDPSYLLYRVILKFVKHFKNSQQIDYATDHGNSYADREKNSPKFFQRKVRAHSCLDLPLEDSSIKYGVQ